MPDQGTNLGPLTTIFTLPPQCTVAIAAPPHAWMGQSCPKSDNVQDATSCWPPIDRGIPQPTIPLAGWGFYSPGIQCPGGHTSACSATAGARGGFPFQFSLAAQETAVGCCPVGFSCSIQEFGWQTCKFDKGKSSAEIQTVTCDTKKGESGGLGVLTMPQATMDVWAPMIQINFQSSDLPPISSTSTSTSSTAGPPPTSPAGSASSGVSSGAIAGIAIGAAAIILGILGAVFFIWRRKRAQRRDDGFSQVGSPGQGGGDVASAQYYTPLGTHPMELDSRQQLGGGVASPAYSDRSGGAVVPVTGANGAQEGKYYYSGYGRSNAVEADGTPAAVEAPGSRIAPTELAG